MKNIFISAVFFSLLVSFNACTTTREAGVTGQTREERKLVNQELVKNAVESRRFIVKLERLYLTGGMIDLRPRSNYIIVDGNKGVISATYFGRQYDIRPIAGINMRGRTTDYELTSKVEKGLYKISMKVENNSSSFDVYLTIGKDGSATASVNSLKIDNARYTGYVVPITIRNVQLQEENGVI